MFAYLCQLLIIAERSYQASDNNRKFRDVALDISKVCDRVRHMSSSLNGYSMSSRIFDMIQFFFQTGKWKSYLTASLFDCFILIQVSFGCISSGFLCCLIFHDDLFDDTCSQLDIYTNDTAFYSWFHSKSGHFDNVKLGADSENNLESVVN